MFHHSKKKFEEYKVDEEYKETLAKENGWTLIRFSYRTKLTKDNVQDILALKMPKEL